MIRLFVIEEFDMSTTINKIFRDKLFMQITDGCMHMNDFIELSPFFAFAESRTDFYCRSEFFSCDERI